MPCSVIRTPRRTKREAIRETVEWMRSEGMVMDAQLYSLSERKRDRSGLPGDDLDAPDILSDTLLFWCGNERIETCSEPTCLYEGEFLCDWPVGDGKTCDLPLCREHRANVGPERDFCPIHASLWRASGAEVPA